jgi:predicted nucleic acid-binding protein
MQFVVDNSVVMAWCFDDESSRYTDAVLDSLKESAAYVPSIWPLEVANVLLVAQKRGRLSRAKSILFMNMLNALPISMEIENRMRIFGEVFSLGSDLGITAYDASYLDLAMRKGIPIATLDTSLRKAAKKCSVPIFLL